MTVNVLPLIISARNYPFAILCGNAYEFKDFIGTI